MFRRVDGEPARYVMLSPSKKRVSLKVSMEKGTKYRKHINKFDLVFAVLNWQMAQAEANNDSEAVTRIQEQRNRIPRVIRAFKAQRQDLKNHLWPMLLNPEADPDAFMTRSQLQTQVETLQNEIQNLRDQLAALKVDPQGAH